MTDSPFGSAFHDKTVLVTGHTGFKGSWLSEWLLSLGARVVGYALDPPTTPSLFETLQLGPRLAADVRADVRSVEALGKTLSEHRPQFVFHLAAQALVRAAYNEPHATFETNCMGSVNVLEAVRRAERPCVVIMVTTDKVYENAEWTHAYREPDRLGGHDPYSASKACAEIAIASYRRSFFSDASGEAGAPSIAVAGVRAGNVIGGGDWATDRIIADSMKSLAAGTTIPVRNRKATRPWQHVLDPLSGYLHLAAEISCAVEGRDARRLSELCSAYNFGPQVASNRTVRELVEAVLTHWTGRWEDFTPPDARHEASKLNLAIDKAYHALGWQPRWGFEESVRHTVEWYRAYYHGGRADSESMRELTRRQIASYSAGLRYPTAGDAG